MNPAFIRPFRSADFPLLTSPRHRFRTSEFRTGHSPCSDAAHDRPVHPVNRPTKLPNLVIIGTPCTRNPSTENAQIASTVRRNRTVTTSRDDKVSGRRADRVVVRRRVAELADESRNQQQPGPRQPRILPGATRFMQRLLTWNTPSQENLPRVFAPPGPLPQRPGGIRRPGRPRRETSSDTGCLAGRRCHDPSRGWIATLSPDKGPLVSKLDTLTRVNEPRGCLKKDHRLARGYEIGGGDIGQETFGIFLRADTIRWSFCPCGPRNRSAFGRCVAGFT